MGVPPPPVVSSLAAHAVRQAIVLEVQASCIVEDVQTKHGHQSTVHNDVETVYVLLLDVQWREGSDRRANTCGQSTLGRSVTSICVPVPIRTHCSLVPVLVHSQ
jgi:hypothetical protein